MVDILTLFTDGIVARLDGPLHFRFIIQPTIATVFAFRDGLSDARKGQSPYGWSLFNDQKHRKFLIQSGWKGISKVFLMAMTLDVVYQLIALKTIKPLAALIAACILALLPYALLRGLVNRFLGHRVRREGH